MLGLTEYFLVCPGNTTTGLFTLVAQMRKVRLREMARSCPKSQSVEDTHLPPKSCPSNYTLPQPRNRTRRLQLEGFSAGKEGRDHIKIRITAF